jgi:alpha-glucosidase
MRSLIDSYPERVLIGEIYLPLKDLMTYYGLDLNGANLPFNFLLLQCPWNTQAIAKVVSEYMKVLPHGAWPNWVLGNHDNARIATRVGRSQSVIAAMLLLTLPGTLTIYYGEEIGMTNALIRAEDVQDPAEKRQPGIGMGRDPERTPLTWDSSEKAGFTQGRPWLPIGADHQTVNVEVEESDEASILNLYRRLIALRRAYPILEGGQLGVLTTLGDLLCYERSDGSQRLVVLLNLGQSPIHAETGAGIILTGTDSRRDSEQVGNFIELRGSEGVIVEVIS